jgi:hypothetical protein
MRPPCFECGEPSENDHHVVPVSRGGSRTVPLCIRCHGLVHGRKMNHICLTQDALDARKARGHVAGNIPYGMKVSEEDGPVSKTNRRVTLVTSPEEQDTIRLIVRLKDHGLSFRAIADKLNSRGIPAKRTIKGVKSIWRQSTVHSLYLKAILGKSE